MVYLLKMGGSFHGYVSHNQVVLQKFTAPPISNFGDQGSTKIRVVRSLGDSQGVGGQPKLMKHRPILWLKICVPSGKLT